MWQTPWSRTLLEKLIFAHMVKKFPSFYGTHSFTNTSRKAHHWILCSASWIKFTHIHPVPLTSILILSSYLCPYFSRRLFCQVSYTKVCMYFYSTFPKCCTVVTWCNGRSVLNSWGPWSADSISARYTGLCPHFYAVLSCTTDSLVTGWSPVQGSPTKCLKWLIHKELLLNRKGKDRIICGSWGRNFRHSFAA
jgi:hypothetical protein